MVTIMDQLFLIWVLMNMDQILSILKTIVYKLQVLGKSILIQAMGLFIYRLKVWVIMNFLWS